MAGTGETLSYRQLEERSNQGAQLFRKLGLKAGDGIAIFMENNIDFLPICWAAQRAGLYYTCVSSRLTAGEVEYIAKDCNAKVLFVSHGLAKTAEDVAALLPDVKRALPSTARSRITKAGKPPPARCPHRASRTRPRAPTCSIPPGTTGRPKDARARCRGLPIDAPNALA